MAALNAEKTVNGNYGVHHNYGHVDNLSKSQVSDPAVASAQASDQEPSTATGVASNSEEEKPIPKEMIGWYFVEQYYNTMSKDPSKLWLYYTKKSQFVAGNEAEKVDVAVGHKSISEKIKDLAYQDCKVRVTNVDSQESAKTILVQVIGEMSNQAAPHRKFVQTFVLAEQPTGYYVLNDIFRYIVDEEEEEEEAANGGLGTQAPEHELEPEPAVAPVSLSEDISAQKQTDLEKVDTKLQADVLDKPTEKAPIESAPTVDAEPKEVAATSSHENIKSDAPNVDENPQPDETTTRDQAAEAVAVEDITQPEKPQDPDPTPIGSPPKTQKATVSEPPAAPKPAAPKTWANLVAAKGSSTAPSSSAVKQAPPATPAALKPKTANASTKENTTPGTPTTEEGSSKPQLNGNSGWQTAGIEKQRQPRQHSQSISSTTENTLGYVKNVTDKVDGYLLRTRLTEFGELKYFDVSRQKNCAFVEFAEPSAYNACVAANPHQIGEEQVFVEERRPRANAFGGNFNNRGGMRGGRPGPNDRPGSQARGGFGKDGGRGGFPPRGGRGGAMTPRTRGGQPQPA